MIRPNTRCRAFTLIEAIIAFTLFTLVLAQLSYIQHAAKLLVDRARSTSAVAVKLSTAFRLFAADCDHFQIPGFLTPNDPSDPVIDLEKVSGSSGASSKISFYVAEYATSGMPEVRKITYMLSGADLVRRSERARDANQANLFQTPVDVVLLSGLTSLDFMFPDGRGGWISNWIGRKGLPQGLRMKFQVQEMPEQTFSKFFGGAFLVVNP